VPGTCADKTHTSCSVLGGLRERARPFRRVSCRFGAASVGSAQRKFYWVCGHVRYLGRPGAHNLQCFRCPQTVPYFPVTTCAPGAPRATKPPPGAPNRVPGSLTYPLDAAVMADGRLGGVGPQELLSRTSAGPQAKLTCQKRLPDAIPVGRGARDAYRRVPRDAPDPPWSMSTNLGEESAEFGRGCSSKIVESKPTSIS